jgi:hypothetical protein
MYAKYAKCGGEYTREVAQRIGLLGYYHPLMCGLARSKGIGGMTFSSLPFPLQYCHIQATSLEQLHLYSFLWNVVTFKQPA